MVGRQGEPIDFSESLNALEDTKGINEIDSLDSISLEDDDGKVENPFKEMRQLITSQQIDVKTILTENQVLRLHRIETVIADLDVCIESFNKQNKNANKRIESMRYVKKLLSSYSNKFMTLIINKDGTSRKQFIEAIGKGADKAEQANSEKQFKLIGVN